MSLIVLTSLVYENEWYSNAPWDEELWDNCCERTSEWLMSPNLKKWSII